MTVRQLARIVSLGAVVAAAAFALASPAQEASASSYTAVAAGGQHTCAKTTSGGLQCWGNNTFGQLGNGAYLTSTGVATAVAGLSSGVSQVDLGTWHSCAATTSGTVKCWGRNALGQLGVGDPGTGQLASSSADPLDVCATGSINAATCVALTGVAQVSAGNLHTCAVTTAGGVKCWGDNGLTRA